ncbi:hypothetical protein MTO96_003282 [Rhipicephalus appendiculatus]
MQQRQKRSKKSKKNQKNQPNRQRSPSSKRRSQVIKQVPRTRSPVPDQNQEDDIWCVRRSERIFLLDAGVVKSSSLSSPPERQEANTSGTSQRAKPEKRRRQKLVSVLRKCSRAVGVTPNDTDSDDQGSDSTENVPLSRLSAAAKGGSVVNVSSC